MRFELAEPAAKPCRNCGSETITWQSAKSGKWYLSEIFTDLDGHTVTDRRDFHSLYCNKPEAHTRKQDNITRVLQEEQQEAEAGRALSQQKREQEALENFIALNDLCESDPEAGRQELEARERELKGFQDNPPTMDYMVEYGRALTRMEVLRSEIETLTNALDAIDEP